MHFLTVRSMFPYMRTPIDFKETCKFIINIRGVGGRISGAGLQKILAGKHFWAQTLTTFLPNQYSVLG